MPGRRWTAADIGDLTGRTAVVTGGSSGIGAETVRMLAEHGARVLLTSRDRARGETVAARLGGRAEVVVADLADLGAVADAAAAVHERVERLDLLVNNAGVMATPFARTVDGFERQLATNHLGHFALTARLLDLLLAAPAPRVVTVSSGLHRGAHIDLDDLDATRGYQPWRAYGQSKLANLLFTLELQRRSDDADAGLLATAAHPGYTATNLQTTGPRAARNPVGRAAIRLMTAVVGQDAATGALPTLRAATDPEAVGAAYYGPSQLGEMRGPPVPVGRSDAALDPETARRLWDASAERTGVEPTFPLD